MREIEKADLARWFVYLQVFEGETFATASAVLRCINSLENGCIFKVIFVVHLSRNALNSLISRRTGEASNFPTFIDRVPRNGC